MPPLIPNLKRRLSSQMRRQMNKAGQRARRVLFGSDFPDRYEPLTVEDIDNIPDITVKENDARSKKT